jgi:D-3-phosphoglycerate dehydrogenase
MADTVENLILDLLEWLGRRERTYQETMEAWRTSCSRLPVWEDATDRGLVETEHTNGRSIVRVTPSGHALLRERRPHSYGGLLQSGSVRKRKHTECIHLLPLKRSPCRYLRCRPAELNFGAVYQSNARCDPRRPICL